MLFNYSKNTGGAGIATERLYDALCKKKIQARLINAHKRKHLSTFFDKIPNKIFQKKPGALWSNGLFSSINIKGHIKSEKQIIHLNWINNGLISIDQVSKIKNPIIWTLHDLWPVTGGCHVVGECRQFESSCENCPLFNQHFIEIAKYLFKKKQRIFGLPNITLTVPSQWMLEMVKKSALGHNSQIEIIPNGIDPHMFKRIKNKDILSKYNISESKMTLLFGANDLLLDKNKGVDLLDEALKILNVFDIELVLLGADNPGQYFKNINTVCIPKLEKYEDLIALYSSVSLVCVPSRVESFGLMALESLQCETPVVAFDFSGTKDIINHKVNGYLARSFDTEDFALGISYIIENIKKLDMETKNENFYIDNVANKFIKLYESLL